MSDIYEQLANLLEYPGTTWDAKVADCASNDLLHEFRSAVAALTLSGLEELYARTFDLNPACALEVGYHLFGENYKRGEFLAHLRETEAPFDLGQSQQLPDYLPVLLRLLTKLEDEELRASLIGECLIPAIDKMLKTFKEGANAYRFLLEAARATLQAEVPAVPIDTPGFKVRARLPVIQPADQPGLYAAARGAGSTREHFSE